MVQAADLTMTVDVEVSSPVAKTQLVKFHMTDPADNVLHREDSYWLDFSLTPRPKNARACYRDHWSPQHFEPLGNVFMLPAGEALHARTDGGPPQESLLCLLNPESIREWFDGELNWTDQRLKASLDIREPAIRSLLLRMVEELRHPGFASETLVELMVEQLAIELGRYCINIEESSSQGGLASWRLRVIEERVKEQRDAPSLTELAELCHISVRQLTRGFRSSQGCSIGEYIAESRVDRAKQMLTGEQSIKAIAYTLGFSSPSSFCYAFRRVAGETPSQFRQRLLRPH